MYVYIYIHTLYIYIYIYIHIHVYFRYVRSHKVWKPYQSYEALKYKHFYILIELLPMKPCCN